MHPGGPGAAGSKGSNHECYRIDVSQNEGRGQEDLDDHRLRLHHGTARGRLRHRFHPRRRLARQRHSRFGRHRVGDDGGHDPPRGRCGPRHEERTRRRRYALHVVSVQRLRRGGERRPPHEGGARQRREAGRRCGSGGPHPCHRRLPDPRVRPYRAHAPGHQRAGRLQGAGQDGRFGPQAAGRRPRGGRGRRLRRGPRGHPRRACRARVGGADHPHHRHRRRRGLRRPGAREPGHARHVPRLHAEVPYRRFSK